jgi:hypothetical protein
VRCALCTPCALGQYMIGCSGPDNLADRTGCAACTACTGYNVRIATTKGMCDGTGTYNRDTSNASTCTPCGSCANLQHISTPCNGTVPVDLHSCSPCTPSDVGCGVGRYILPSSCDGTGTTSSFQCQPCTQCTQGRLPTTSQACTGFTRSPDQGCRYCNSSACPAGSYASGGCNETHPTVLCSACRPPCPPGSVETNPCGGDTLDRQCAECAACPAGKYLDTSRPCNTTSSPCVACRDSCPDEGHYLSSPCPGGRGSFSDTTVCTPCRASCGEGRYLSASCPAGGNQTSDVSRCSDCAQCPPGTYQSGPGCPGNGTIPDEGVSCSACPPCQGGHYSAPLPSTEGGGVGGYCDPATGARLCLPCSPCHGDASSVASSPCQGDGYTPDQGCVSCLEARGPCPAGSYLRLAGVDASSCECEACGQPNPPCAPGEYVAGCNGSTHAAGVGSLWCEPCEACPAQHYPSSPCSSGTGYTSSQGCKRCRCYEDYIDGMPCQVRQRFPPPHPPQPAGF